MSNRYDVKTDYFTCYIVHGNGLWYLELGVDVLIFIVIHAKKICSYSTTTTVSSLRKDRILIDIISSHVETELTR